MLWFGNPLRMMILIWKLIFGCYSTHYNCKLADTWNTEQRSVPKKFGLRGDQDKFWTFHCCLFFPLRIHWSLSTILKTRKKVYEVFFVFFWYVTVCIFWECIQYTIHWDKTQMLKKNPLDKINGTKTALFFLSQASTHHSFTFNLRFLY